MSQTETLLLFVLGFFACLFVVLLFGRGIFSVLGKLSGWRETRKVPAAIRELQAERDGLKAEKAMMAQKLEASITDMKMRMAEQMAEVSRNRNRLLDLSQTLKERESTIEHLQTQFEDKSAQASSLQSQIEDNVKSINLAYAKMANRDDEHAKMQQVLKDAQATLVSRDEKIRNLMDEAKALREIAANYVGNTGSVKAADQLENPVIGSYPLLRPPVLVSSLSAPETFEMSSASSNSTNPLLVEHDVEDQILREPFKNIADYRESDSVDRSVSNVLSLAERVRNLKTGMKKA
jgi:chromosome segregation ATPase